LLIVGLFGAVRVEAHQVRAARVEDAAGRLKPLDASPDGVPSGVNGTFLDWDICGSSCHSNLGGVGPDGGAMYIRYAKVVRSSLGELDLIVTNSTPYTAYNISQNGKQKSAQCLGLVNMAHDTKVTLAFNFVMANTHKPAKLERFFFTVLDLDRSDDDGSDTAASFPHDIGKFWLDGQSELKVTGSKDPASLKSHFTFHSSVVGDGDDNPTSALDLSQLQRGRAVTVEFSKRSWFSLTFEIKGGNHGRNIIWSGYSPLGLSGNEVTESQMPSSWVATDVETFKPSPAPTPEPTPVPTVAATEAIDNSTDTLQLNEWQTQLSKLHEVVKRELQMVVNGSGYGPVVPVGPALTPAESTHPWGKQNVGGTKRKNNVKIEVDGDWNIAPKSENQVAEALQWASDFFGTPLSARDRFDIGLPDNQITR